MTNCPCKRRNGGGYNKYTPGEIKIRFKLPISPEAISNAVDRINDIHAVLGFGRRRWIYDCPHNAEIFTWQARLTKSPAPKKKRKKE
ncbi:MAG TPA: hypothetical protein VFA55_06435 [Candidatus Kapabacteria bacterium]|nr:hypothetical protein [Candidatus Kapabacteria bacterium]